jgi:predicted nucleotidyltransferase
MITDSCPDSLTATLFGKTRRTVLSLIYTHADESFYLRQIARSVGAGLGAVQRELKSLSNAGIIMRLVKGRQVYYQANAGCPIFAELKSILIKTAGIGDVLKAALAPLADRIEVAVIFGSMARGKEKRISDVDMLIVGNLTLGEVVTALQAAQKTLRREINPSLYPATEFQSKLAAGNHFLRTILKEPMVFLIGNKGELARLAKKRLAG